MLNMILKNNMDEFILPIDNEKFRKTNYPWNQLMLNDPWSVGYVSMLIELKVFTKKEEWEEFYFEMGEYRLKKMNGLSNEIIELLEDEQLIRNDKAKVYKLAKEIIDINKLNGRTETQLRKKGKILYEFIKNKQTDITEEECFQAVKYRVIGETWNGIILREHNTIKVLTQKFPKANFVKKEGEFDFNYAVDYEIYFNGQLICGIQIKPKSYTYNTPYILKARRANLAKNTKYYEEFNAPVFDVISTARGNINNIYVLDKITSLLK